MRGFILGIHIFSALLLIVLILMQQRQGGLSSVFGGGQSVFGGRGAAPFLTKVTIVLFTIFVITSVGLAWMSGRIRRPESAIEKAIKKGEMTPPTMPYEQPFEGE
ncbi:preprotein translocase subunit SecG [candidate division WOR-3 bacterium]|nr:preprotein translocase subunit SecG [candidate division WOR-3 bacterium]